MDLQKRLLLKFIIKNKQSNAQVLVHQAFISLVHKDLKSEVILISTANKKDGNLYSLELVIFLKIIRFIQNKVFVNDF